MLDGGDATSVIADLWETAEPKTRLPEQYEAFAASRGPTPLHFDSRRAYHRYFLRHKAILQRQDASFGVYTKDVSRQGIGILTPMQLLPKERVQLRLPSGVQYQLEVARCRRVDVGCYECGTRFVL
jgi:hypothetical protein